MLPAIKNGRSGYFVQQNRGKKSLCLDFSKPESMELLKSLVPKIDVVLENFGPGVMEKRGLDYPSLKQLNPRIILGVDFGLRQNRTAVSTKSVTI